MRTYGTRGSKSTATASAAQKQNDDQFVQRNVGNLAMEQLLRERDAEEELEDDSDNPDPIPWRKKPHTSKKFSGRTGIFGGMRGKYRRIWSWTWGKGKVEQESPTTTKRQQTRTTSNTAGIPLTGDSNITGHGAAFYANEPIAGRIPLANFENQRTIVAPIPTPSLGARETSQVLASATQLAASLTFRFGDAGDPAGRPLGRILVDMLDPTTGVLTQVHDTNWLNTNGQWQTQALNPAILMPNTTYWVRVFVEYWDRRPSPGYDWADGRTQVDYSFTISQTEQRDFEITKTIPGKKEQVKDPKSFRIRL